MFTFPVTIFGKSGHTVNAVDFDGVNDYLTRGTGYTGAANSKLWTGSFWINKQGSDGAQEKLIHSSGSDSNAYIRKTTNDQIGFNASFDSNSKLSISSSPNSIEVADGWVHVLFSLDMSDTGKRHIYINDVSDLYIALTYIDSALDFTASEWTIGRDNDASEKLDAFISEFWMDPGTYIDFSVQANRRKFISPVLKPVDLGATGQLPTGTAPLVYHSGETVDWHNNLGGGGGMTENGALTTASSSPSD